MLRTQSRRSELVKDIRPILEDYTQSKGIEYGEVIVKAIIHNGRIAWINVTEEEKIKVI